MNTMSKFLGWRWLLVAAALVAFASPCLCQDVPKTMCKISVKGVEPAPEPDSFTAQAKTYWRAGAKYARIAEVEDPKNHMHGLAVISEPDVWMINLFDKSAKHMVDHGPTFDVHLPIFPSKTDTKTKLDGLEFGNELEFLTKNNATRASDKVIGGKATDRYDLRIGSSKITLWTDSQSNKPLRIRQTKDMHTETFEYVSYEDDLAFDPSLFRPPSGLRIEESR
jgi:outer membrane lipoprotein-sorting protein